MMSLLRYLLIGLTLAALIFIAIVLGSEIYERGLPSIPWSEVLAGFGIMGALILNATYLVLNRPSRVRLSDRPSTGAVNVKALAYLGAACVIAWFVVDIAVKIHQEQRLTAQPSSSGYYRR
jgi:hypothetical protein